MDRDKGVIYYATGREYFCRAKHSAISLKEHNDFSTAIYTDMDVNTSVFDKVVEISSAENPFLDRIRHFKKTPYEKTIYIDSDTIIQGDLEPIFEVLDRFDIAARVDPFRNTASKHWGSDYASIDVPEAFPEYQCGVLGFVSNERVMKTFNSWENRYSEVVESDLIDQPFFREAVYNHDVEIGTLPPEYNLLVNNLNILQKEGVVFHFNGGYLDEGGLPILSDKNKDKVIRRINSDSPLRRAVYPGKWGKTRILTEPDPPSLFTVYNYIFDHGVLSTLTKGIKKYIH